VPEDIEHPAGRDANVRPGPADSGRVPIVGIASAIVLAIAVGIALWLLLRGGEADRPQQAPAAAVSIPRLDAFASSVGHPIYWVGAQPRFTYELSRTRDGRVYIRYLPPGVGIGNPNPKYLTVGTYPQRHALVTLRATAKKQGVHTVQLAGGGRAFQYKGRPTSVYLAYPGSDYQVEVFDPSPTRALQLVTSGHVQPVGAPPHTAAPSTAVSAKQLKALPRALGHPIYWAGGRSDTTYELTRTRDGSVYIRYLPRGVSPGDRRVSSLTIGTYPQKRALERLRATAAKNQGPTMRLDHGGVALVDKMHPTSVYLAYPNLDLQLEVYDPAPGRARRLVASGQIAPVR
jgi:hypothetical protein